MTSKNVSTRLLEHNDCEYPIAFTNSGIPWSFFYIIDCNSISQARRIESHIKKMKSRKYIENLVQYPEITQKLLNMYH